MNRGYSLVELLIVLVATAVLIAISVPRLGMAADRFAVERAVRETIAFYHRARATAVFHGAPVRVVLRSDSLIAAFEGTRDSVWAARKGPSRYGVEVSASRTVIRVLPNGLGHGAANTTLVFIRGLARDSVATSRLGRIRRLP